MTITKGDIIQIVPERGPVRIMRVSHVEHHVITLADTEASDDRNLREHNVGQDKEDKEHRELPAEAYPPWPWKELDELSERLYHFMTGAVGQALLAAGEDPRDKALFALRCAQVADGIRSRATSGWTVEAS